MTAEQVVAETRAEIEKLDAGIAQWDGVYREANNEYKRGQRRARGIESIDMDALLSGEEIAGVGSARMDKLVDQARDASHRKTLLEQGRAVLETAHQKAKDRHARELAQKREKAYRKAQQRLVDAVVAVSKAAADERAILADIERETGSTAHLPVLNPLACPTVWVDVYLDKLFGISRGPHGECVQTNEPPNGLKDPRPR